MNAAKVPADWETDSDDSSHNVGPNYAEQETMIKVDLNGIFGKA